MPDKVKHLKQQFTMQRSKEYLCIPFLPLIFSFRLFDEQTDVLILVFMEEIPSYLLSPYHRMRKMLKRKTYLSWPRAGAHTELFWEKLCQALETREDPEANMLLLTVSTVP
uniref:TIR domain-containing protein n=1 Tax=Neolamprologus brichardi TaxID=32507 RepID=A0A3Q4GKI3_NEOBR